MTERFLLVELTSVMIAADGQTVVLEQNVKLRDGSESVSQYVIPVSSILHMQAEPDTDTLYLYLTDEAAYHLIIPSAKYYATVQGILLNVISGFESFTTRASLESNSK